GINLLPHAVRELTELGLGEELAKLGVPTSRLSYFNRFGQEIWSEPRGIGAGYRWPQYSIHRGELQMLLRDTVDRVLPGSIRLGSAVQSSTPAAVGGEEVVVRTQDGAESVFRADVVVGADGIHSTLRTLRYPDQGDPVWNGLMLWRGTAWVEPYLDGRTMIMAGDGQQKFVAYPLTGASTDPDHRGLVRLNFIAERRVPGEGPGENSWTRTADPAEVAREFRDWGFGWLDVPQVIASATELLRYPMVDRDPVAQWTFGCQTLLGDAAHPMYPIGSNGASQAIIDSRTLAYELATAPTVGDALSRYESARLPLTAALTLSNRQLGPERVMQLAFERAPGGFAHIHDVVSQDELESIATQYKRAAGFAPELLNERASLSVN
ncbi:MAG: flavin-dependent oxidoreductase, partial [Salinibacterium sp.]|nr:flavin-dependent oxidoreductase [Salinibacterium sp.]